MAQKQTLQKLLMENMEYVRFASDVKERHYFPSGILGLNYAIADNGGRGIPGGSIVQIIAKEKRGKSTISLDFLAQAQKSGIKEIEVPIDKNETRTINAAYIDFERSFDPVYAHALGVNLDKLYIIETLYAEQAYDIAEALLSEGLQCIIVDSIAMAVPESEADRSNQDSERMGAEAKAIGRFLKRAISLTDYANALIVLINQYRGNLSPMAHSEVKPYGAWLVRYGIKLSIKLERIKNTESRTTVEAFIEKTKFGPEAKRAEFDIVFGKGPDYARHILTMAQEAGIITGTTWLQYKDMKAQGMKNAVNVFPLEDIKRELIAYYDENKKSV